MNTVSECIWCQMVISSVTNRKFCTVNLNLQVILTCYSHFCSWKSTLGMPIVNQNEQQNLQNKYIWRYKSIIVFVQTENYTTTNYFLRSKCSLLQNCKQSNGSELMYILYRHFSAQIYRLMNCIHTGMCDCSLLKILDTFLLVTKTIFCWSRKLMFYIFIYI